MSDVAAPCVSIRGFGSMVVFFWIQAHSCKLTLCASKAFPQLQQSIERIRSIFNVLRDDKLRHVMGSQVTYARSGTLSIFVLL